MFKFVPLASFVLLAACSDRPAGESDFYDQVSIVALEREARQRQQNQVIQQVDPAPFGQPASVITQVPVQAPPSDIDLVQSLNQAIESAGDQGQRVVTQAPQGATTQAQQVVVTGQTSPAQLPQSSDAITDNSFNTIVQSETIETDRERMAVLSQQTQVLEAQPLPENTTGVNLASFARSTNHKIGDRVYSRASRSRSEASRQCRQYGNPDEAQRAFLAAGGPQKDTKKMDPDGDGFVCGWSPIPFRNLSVGSGG